MKQFRNGLPLVVSAAALFGLANCGVYGGGGGGPTVDVRGNIEAIESDVNETDRDIVVFVYTLKGNDPDCEIPELPDVDGQAQVRRLEPGETEFEVRNAKAGRLVVVFLLDDPGNQADGRIDPGDPVAVLNDPDCVLEDVPNKYIVQVDDVRINFSEDDVNNFPEAGRAEADDINEGPE